eukprot:CAMPEP_0179200556 /NCGR_PEP_ID=MMETSP0796-20121207/99811_1 /TAXON_ID=73915 /ORGANISM="Pyrodinium bahamense, Strain pbaha01" /LENGTH=106 /DNA_ID=CAMNT_0020905111 /DNA_START=491 /DNA_END=808 /DNA_ORIENTATION=-
MRGTACCCEPTTAQSSARRATGCCNKLVGSSTSASDCLPPPDFCEGQMPAWQNSSNMGFTSECHAFAQRRTQAVSWCLLTAAHNFLQWWRGSLQLPWCGCATSASG